MNINDEVFNQSEGEANNLIESMLREKNAIRGSCVKITTNKCKTICCLKRLQGASSDSLALRRLF